MPRIRSHTALPRRASGRFNPRLARVATVALALIAGTLVFAATALSDATPARHPRSARPAKVLLGNATIESQRDALIPGRPEAFGLRARASGQIATLRLYIDAQSTATTVLIGLYTNSDRGPGTLLGTGSLTAPHRGAWNSVTLAPSQLTTGHRYWLTILGEGGTLRYRASRRGRCPSDASIRANLRALPIAWSAGRFHRHTHCPISAYATAASVRGSSGPSVAPPIPASVLSAPLAPVVPVTTIPPAEKAPTKEHTPEEVETKEEPPPPPTAPVHTTLPAITGTTTEGDTLTTTTGAWENAPTSYKYQWQDCNTKGEGCAAISGATSTAHKLASSDVGHTLRVVVTATNEGGSKPATSAQTATVAAAASGTPYPKCTQTLSLGANVSSAVSGAADGSVICLNSGEYGSLTLNASPASDVTLQAAPSAHVTTRAVHISGSHLVVRGLWIDGEVALEEGSSFITVDHDDISNANESGGEGVVFDTSNCTAPNAPTWEGCEPHAQIANVTISGNHFHDIGQKQSEDAIHLDYWRNVVVTGNEFEHVIESGNHTDCLQSVYGGTNLTFTHNYEHDNDCQGFFIKDGDASNVSITDNLFLRDNEPDEKGERFANYAQAWNIENLTVEHNTIWDGKGLALVTEDASVSPSATIDHNLITALTINKPIGKGYALSEDYNIFDEAPWSFTPSSTDTTNSNPQFVDTATDDYRLATNPNGIGIDWSPTEEQYGPAS
jgi:Right handed beta helix region